MTEHPSPDNINAFVDHLFRRKSGQLIATLTRIFGPEHIALAEDVVQETLLKALQLWPYRGVPENPGAEKNERCSLTSLSTASARAGASAASPCARSDRPTRHASANPATSSIRKSAC